MAQPSDARLLGTRRPRLHDRAHARPRPLRRRRPRSRSPRRRSTTSAPEATDPAAARAGNVPAGAIAQVLSGVVVAGVTNPRPPRAAPTPSRDADVLARGPLPVRHRRQAVTGADYEALALDASPAVAVARRGDDSALRDGDDRPHSPDPQPEPSCELRRAVRDVPPRARSGRRSAEPSRRVAVLCARRRLCRRRARARRRRRGQSSPRHARTRRASCIR